MPSLLASPSAHLSCSLAVALLAYTRKKEILVKRLYADIRLCNADEGHEGAPPVVSLGVSYDLGLLDGPEVFEEVGDLVLVPDFRDLADEEFHGDGF